MKSPPEPQLPCRSLLAVLHADAACDLIRRHSGDTFNIVTRVPTLAHTAAAAGGRP